MSKIYGLFDPITGELKYIGKTSNKLNDRLSTHIWCAKNKGRKNLLYAWIKSLLNKNLKPIISVIEENEEQFINEREKYWISFYKEKTKLKNQQPGGDGQPKGYQFKKRHIPLKGVIPKQLLGLPHTGYIRDENWRKNASLKLKGKKQPHLNKKIIAKNIKTNIEICFSSIIDASIYLNLNKAHICSCCNHKLYRHKEYKFKYINSDYSVDKTGKGIKKSVYLYQNNGLIKQYNSILEASKQLKIKRDTIMRYCKFNKTKYGYTWSYKCLD